jgi:hypothetical protein
MVCSGLQAQKLPKLLWTVKKLKNPVSSGKKYFLQKNWPYQFHSKNRKALIIWLAVSTCFKYSTELVYNISCTLLINKCTTKEDNPVLKLLFLEIAKPASFVKDCSYKELHPSLFPSLFTCPYLK